jgi:hypothetical protein
VDTLGAVLPSMAQFALEQEQTDTASFRRTAEAWARHVLLAVPPPGAARGERLG